MNKKTILLKIGGSILSPRPDLLFDFAIAREVKEALLPLTDEYQFIINTGGGALSKMYQDSVRAEKYSERCVNWIGTEACNMNAVMMRIVFDELAEDIPITGQAVKETTPIESSQPFVVVGAADPGHSSDYDAVLVAKRTGAKHVISLKNVDGIYSEDPRNNPDAEKFEKLSWDEYKSILGTETFTPKMPAPIDPIATKEAAKMGLRFTILDGRDIPNLIAAIEGDRFVGSVVE